MLFFGARAHTEANTRKKQEERRKKKEEKKTDIPKKDYLAHKSNKKACFGVNHLAQNY